MANITTKDEARFHTEERIRHDFLAPDGSESREAAELIAARNRDFCKSIPSNEDWKDMKLAVESLSGGTNTVILDDLGQPSIMMLIPKMNAADLSNGLLRRTHPAFIVKGREYDTVAIGKYASFVKNGRACSLPMKDPAVDHAFDDCAALCSAKGKGWGITPFSLWGAIALWSKKNGTMPEGNTYYGQHNDDASSHGIASWMDKREGLPVPGRTFTGSGPLTWFHNHRTDGIADMSGNVAEWCSGFRMCNGEIQLIENADVMAPGCDMSFESPLWRAILPDGSLTNPGDNDSLKLDYVDGYWKLCRTITNHSEEKRIATMPDMKLADGLTEMPQILIELGFCPERQLTGSPYGRYGKEFINGPNKGVEQFPSRGGIWYSYLFQSSGIFNTSLYYGRDLIGNTVGMRLAYYPIGD